MPVIIAYRPNWSNYTKLMNYSVIPEDPSFCIEEIARFPLCSLNTELLQVIEHNLPSPDYF